MVRMYHVISYEQLSFCWPTSKDERIGILTNGVDSCIAAALEDMIHQLFLKMDVILILDL